MALSKRALTVFALTAAAYADAKDAKAQEVSQGSPPAQAQPASQADDAAYEQQSDPVMVGAAAEQQDVFEYATDEALAICGPYYSIESPCPELAQIQRVRSAIQEPGRSYYVGTLLVMKNGQPDYENSYDLWGMNDIDHGGVRDERRITAEIVGVPDVTDGTEVEYVPDEYGSEQFRAWELQSVVDAIEGAVGFPLTNEQIIWSIVMPNVHKGEGRPSPNDIVIFRASSVAGNLHEVRISSAPNAGTDVYDVMVHCRDRRCTGENVLPLQHLDEDGQMIRLPDGTRLEHWMELEGLDNPMVLYSPVTGRDEEYTDCVYAIRMDAYFPQPSQTAVVAPGQVPGVEYVPPTVPPGQQPAPLPQCSDNVDNDLDTLVDARDPGCEDGFDNDEYNPIPALPQCSNGLDDDGDSHVDARDPGCDNGADNDESNPIAPPPCPPAPGCPSTECPPCPGLGAGTVEQPGEGQEVPPQDVGPVVPTVPDGDEEPAFNPPGHLGLSYVSMFSKSNENVSGDYFMFMLSGGGNIPGSDWHMQGDIGFGYPYAGTAWDPRSRLTEPNPDDPYGLRSVVEASLDDYMIALGVGATWRTPVDWLQLDFGAGGLISVRDRHVREELAYQNGEVAEENRYDEQDVGFAGIYTRLGAGIRPADWLSVDVGGLAAVDEEANVSGGPYGGVRIYFP